MWGNIEGKDWEREVKSWCEKVNGVRESEQTERCGVRGENRQTEMDKCGWRRRRGAVVR